MQAIELLIIAGSAIAVVALLAVRHRNGANDISRWPRILMGIVPGLIGVALVVIPQADMIPDEAEGAAWMAVAIVVSAFAILGTFYRLARG